MNALKWLNQLPNNQNSMNFNSIIFGCNDNLFPSAEMVANRCGTARKPLGNQSDIIRRKLLLMLLSVVHISLEKNKQTNKQTNNIGLNNEDIWNRIGTALERQSNRHKTSSTSQKSLNQMKFYCTKLNWRI